MDILALISSLTGANPNTVIILGAALAVSEALSLIPAIKSNGIFQLISNIIKKVVKK